MKQFIFDFLTILLLTATGVSSVHAISGERVVTEQNYREIFPKRWIEYLHALGAVEGKLFYRYTRNGQNDGEFISEFICYYPLLADILGLQQGGADDVTVTGRTYFFRLERETANDAWVIERLNKRPNSKRLQDWTFPRHFHTDFNDAGDPVGYSIFNTLGVGLFASRSLPNLPDIFQSEFFRVNKIEFLEVEGKKQVFLDFDYTYPDLPEDIQGADELKNHPDWKPFSLQGQVWLETDYYLIVKGKFHTVFLSEEHQTTVECDYDCNTYKIPLPKKYRRVSQYDFKDDQIKGTLETNIEYDLRETNPKDAKRFTLSAFGLPEPDFGGRRMSLLRIVLMVVGAILIATGAWQMYQKRRGRMA